MIDFVENKARWASRRSCALDQTFTISVQAASVRERRRFAAGAREKYEQSRRRSKILIKRLASPTAS